MDKRCRGSSPEKTVRKSDSIKIDTKELKKIKVKIERKLRGSNATEEIDHTLDNLEEIKIYRCDGEGSRPIFARSDIVVNNTEEAELRTVSTSQRSPNTSHRSPQRRLETSRRGHSRSPRVSRSNRNSSSPYRDRSGNSRRDFDSRNRSRSRDRPSRRSRSRSLRRRRNSRSPHDRERRYERRNYGPSDRDRRRNRSRERYRSPARRRSRSRPSHMPSIDPTTVIPVYIPPYFGPDEALWLPPPIRPPIMMRPGVPLPPRGMYRGPMPGIRPPYMVPGQPPFRQIRPQIRPSNFP